VSPAEFFLFRESYDFSLPHIFRALYAPLIPAIDAPSFTTNDGFTFDLTQRPVWTEALGRRLCIVDIDTRPLDGQDQVKGPDILNWNHADYLSAGMMNHYLYGK
jgi:hypothetical protein